MCFAGVVGVRAEAVRALLVAVAAHAVGFLVDAMTARSRIFAHLSLWTVTIRITMAGLATAIVFAESPHALFVGDTGRVVGALGDASVGAIVRALRVLVAHLAVRLFRGADIRPIILVAIFAHRAVLMLEALARTAAMEGGVVVIADAAFALRVVVADREKRFQRAARAKDAISEALEIALAIAAFGERRRARRRIAEALALIVVRAG